MPQNSERSRRGLGDAGAKASARPTWQGVFTLTTLLVTVAAMIAADYFKCLPPMHITACVGAIAVVLFRVLTQKEAFAAFDLQAVFLLSFMTPLGSAMMKTGAAQKIADAVVGVGGGDGPMILMAVLWLTVWGLTQVMSNTATCALFCPIGWTIAKTLGADPRAVVIAILIASSVAVCTPLAIPANSMIFSASKFNPIEESRILAECTLTVLGFEKEIGKADSETASKIFLKLKE